MAEEDIHAVFAPGRLFHLRRTDAPKPDYVAIAKAEALASGARGAGGRVGAHLTLW